LREQTVIASFELLGYSAGINAAAPTIYRAAA
jgi:hypothetical protein